MFSKTIAIFRYSSAFCPQIFTKLEETMCIYIYIYMALAYFALLETQKDRSYQRSYLRGETVMGWATIQQQKKKVAAESFF